MHDSRTSSGDDRPVNGSKGRPLAHDGNPIRWIALLWAFALLSLIPGHATTVNGGQNGTLYWSKTVKLVCGTYPVSKTIYYYTGTTWKSVLIGPGRSDHTIQGAPALISTVQYTNPGPVGSTITVNTTSQSITIPFAGSIAAQTSGPIINARCDLIAESIQIYAQSAGTRGINAYGSPILINPVDIEGAFSVWVDDGRPSDNDGDGIPDSEDPDDDNDGRDDFSDKFPNDPNEKDDTDNDGQGDNADLDDDNDGHPDTDDDFPYDSGQYFSDRDGDGIRDRDDKFPDNNRESQDTDDDGVGDNSDPDDDNDGLQDSNDTRPKIPDVRPGITPVPPGNVGDGQGNPGIGDGGGGSGPKPTNPGGGGTGEGEGEFGTGTATNSDETGAVLPSAQQDVNGTVTNARGAMGNKIGNYRPFGSQLLPMTTTYTIDVPFMGRNFSYTFHFDQPPFTLIRSLLLIIVVYVVGHDTFKRLTI